MSSRVPTDFNPDSTYINYPVIPQSLPTRLDAFQSTHSLRSATPEAGERGLVRAVSIHALLAECDVMSQFHLSRFNRFNPRTPCGVRHAMLSCAGPCRRFQSTHSLRSATGYCWTRRQGLSVSIHALLAECDEICNDYKNQQYGFNPRTPCGVRLSDWFSPCPANQFQSTHSLRSATCFSGIRKTCRKVSIHALLAECDSLRMKQLVDVLAFQSTHSLRSATRSDGSPHPDHVVSIHALLAECDKNNAKLCSSKGGFNPRTPCGVRH